MTKGEYDIFRLFIVIVDSVLDDGFLWAVLSLFWRSVLSLSSKRIDYRQSCCKCRQGPLVKYFVLDMETVKNLETSAKQRKFTWHHRHKTGSTSDKNLYAPSNPVRNCVYETLRSCVA